jgi:lipopolysaccharide transport system ATP-binding protein
VGGSGLLKPKKGLLMSCRPVIHLKNLNKCYQLYAQPVDRLKQFIWRGKRKFYKDFWALRDINLEINMGEVIGIVGRNGAGKSTLLQLVCGTLTPSSGEVTVDGRIAALLELGAGFNPEFTGRENVYMSATILGLSDEEIASRFDEIINFSGIRDFIDQPVKTYSSGMYVRLAFSVAINVSPDILIIDEALSVGDGEFSRKSFDQIMTLKNAGKTILFCSHSVYQIEALCDRAIWLEKGQIRMMGLASEVGTQYSRSLLPENDKITEDASNQAVTNNIPQGTANITAVSASVDGVVGTCLEVKSQKSTIKLSIQFNFDAQLPTPSIVITFQTPGGLGISSMSTYHDNIDLTSWAQKDNRVDVEFTEIPLLKGDYFISIYLGCEKAIHCYDNAVNIIKLQVTQEGTEQGFVMLPHQWKPVSL